MSSANSVSTLSQSGRRYHARRRLEGLVYVDFNPDNGAILIDLGEGGLGFKSVVPVSTGEALLLKFKLPGDCNHIEAYAEVAWLNESRKGGGLRFVELSPDACAQIRAWTRVPSAPECGPPQTEKGTDSNSAQDRMTECAPANSIEESTRPQGTAPEQTKGAELPGQVSEAFACTESAEGTSLCPEINGARLPDEIAGENVPAGPGWSPVTLLVPEFAVEITTATDSIEPLGARVDSGLSVGPSISATGATDFDASESAMPHKLDTFEDAPEPTELFEFAGQQRSRESRRTGSWPSNDSGDRSSDTPKTLARWKSTAARHVSPESELPTQGSPPSEVSLGHAGVTRPRDFTSGSSSPAPATTSRPARVLASDSRNFVPVQERQRKPTPSKPESSLPPADRQDSTVRGSFVRHPQKPAPVSTEWENLPPSQEGELKPQGTLASQALKLGIGAAAGTCLVLVLIAGGASLRTRVQATAATGRSGGSNVAGPLAFQVEVADLNNRRWILRGGGEAGSPLSDTPPRLERYPQASAAARNGSANSSRSDEFADSSSTVQAPQPREPRPGELALSRPHATQAGELSALLVAPSIFEGITPPIGSVGDQLAASGPEAPRIVQPEVRSTSRASVLQAAVLMERVAPIYPSDARGSHLQGEVLVSATIGTDGVPTNLKVVKGDRRLVPAALTAIRQWRYRPATLGAQPIETQITVSINFQLK